MNLLLLPLRAICIKLRGKTTKKQNCAPIIKSQHVTYTHGLYNCMDVYLKKKKEEEVLWHVYLKLYDSTNHDGAMKNLLKAHRPSYFIAFSRLYQP